MDVMHSKRKKSALVAAGAIAFLISGTISGSAQADSEEPVDTEQLALTEFRDNLVTEDRGEDVQKFDGLNDGQRTNLADYLLGETPATFTPPSDAEVEYDENGVRYTRGDFTWGVPNEMPTVGMRAAGNSMWGTQWFSFAGIKLIETKLSMTYTVGWDPNRGSVITGIQSYNCYVTQDADIFAEVTASNAKAWPNGWEAVAECEVTVRRGAPTPWGQVTWSSRTGVQYLVGDNTGMVVAHGWR